MFINLLTNMSTQELKTKLQKPYNREEWLNVAKDIFKNVSILSKPLEIGNAKSFVKSFQQLGFVNLQDGRNLAIIEVKVDDTKKLSSNKVELRNLTSNLIDEHTTNGVLVIYDNDMDGNYRFSFVTKETGINEETGKFETKETSAKRFTYLLGPGESCSTAAMQLSQVAEKGGHAVMEDIIKAFNVEKVNKDFFNGYKKQYETFTAHLSKPSIKASVFNGDDKAIRDFAKKMMGRIVFIYFLQKKGWMGVPVSEPNWAKGDSDFLCNIFVNSGRGEDFYAVWLSNIFFNCLNTERPGQLFKLPDGTKVKVPYLNGGLFEKENSKTDLLTFPPALFQNLFDFLGQYNFTIYEDDPEERFLAVDPEMLGHIFENLLEDNKDKGAFYTPKEIVHYMCRESLIEYLYTKLNPSTTESYKEIGKSQTELFGNKEKKQLSLEQTFGSPKELVKRDAIEKLVLHHEAAEIINYEKEILKALYEVKICDPAIGSGAFPMGLLTEIFQLVETLYHITPDVTAEVWKLGDSWNGATVKKQIIQNSIYGVDIEKGAVDIARLRFWLSLIIDEEEPNPLPNLDYKIVVGNSLLSKFEDEIIDIDWEVKLKNASSVSAIIIDQQAKLYLLHTKLLLFFNAKGDKLNLKREIRNIKVQVLINQLTLNRIHYSESNKIQLSAFSTEKDKLKAEGVTEKIRDYNRVIHKLESIKKNKDLPLEFFDWKLDFAEIMNEKINKGNVGFDIVIGNPPYGNLFNDKSKIYLRSKFQLLQFKIDAYSAFLIIGNLLQKYKGTLIYIIPSNFMDNKFEEKVREEFLQKNEILLIHELDDNIFHSAVIHSMIFSVRKNSLSFNYNINVSTSLNLWEEKKKIPKSFFITQQFKSLAIRSFENKGFINKVGSNSKALAEVIDIRQAIKSGNDNKYISSQKKNNNWKPILGGKHVNKYLIKDPSLFIHYGKHLACPRDKMIFEQPKILIREAGKEIIATYDDSDYYIMSSLYNAILIDEEYDLKFILALLNSSVFLFLMKKIAFEKTEGAFTKAKIFHYYELPVKITSKKEQAPFVKIVSKILKDKSKGKDVYILERQLDILVYLLYELTYEDASMIEGNDTWMKKKEYEKFLME